MSTWLLLRHEARPPAWNMACDEWLLSHIHQWNLPLLRIYAWDRPSVTIGYFQEYPMELATTHTIIRRPTGGALVQHDHDLTFTVVVPPEHPWKKMKPDDRYREVHQRVEKIFIQRGEKPELLPVKDEAAPHPSGRASALGQCFTQPSRYDVMVPAGKVAGGAQRVTREGLLHQGSIQGESLPRVLPKELIQAWEMGGAIWKELQLDADQISEIEKLARDKFDTVEWNRRVG